MNRFFRTAYATTLVYLLLTLFAVLIARVGMPFPAFSCLYFGLLLCLLPGALPHLNGKERLFPVSAPRWRCWGSSRWPFGAARRSIG